MTDQELAAAVRKAVNELNAAFSKAYLAYLRVEVELTETEAIGDRLPKLNIHATVSREIK